jgi:SAM-dependent methyltransferase
LASITYDAALDAVRGRLDRADASLEISISCDERPWATVPALPVPADPGTYEFTCGLPPVETATRGRIAARTSDGILLAAAEVTRQPLKNAHGLLASEIFEIDHHPFSAIPWLAFDGARITLTGMHLPPEGDPAKLDVAFGPGVSYRFQYGRPYPEFRSHYWYWPNSDLSGLILTIDLAASERHSDPFHFRFVYPEPSRPGGGKRSVGFWLPSNLGSFRGFPDEPSQLTRVQAFSNSATVAITGYNAFRTLEELFARAGIEAERGPSILDWGCGHGRIACHFIDGWPNARLYGTDIDAENVAWCNRALARGRFEVSPLWPPTSFSEASFDGIFGISVMTHLSAEAQRAWFAELARIARPDGIVLLTFGAEGTAAYQTVWRDTAWWTRWRDVAFDDRQFDPALEGKIVDDRYYRNTIQSTRSFIDESSRDFEVLWIERAAFGGYQDCAVLRRR